MMKRSILVLAMIVSAGIAQATFYAYDSFSSGTAGDDVVGTEGGSGWSTAWTADSGDTASMTLVDPGMEFTDVDSEGYKVVFDPDTGSTTYVIRTLSSAVTVDASNTEAWASALIEIGSGSGDVNAGRGIGVELTNGGTPVVGFGKRLNKRFGIGESMGSGDWENTTVVATTVGVRFLALQLAFDGTDTVATIYVSNDPAADISDPTTFDGSATLTISGAVTFDGVRLYGYHKGTTSNSFDEIRVGSYYDQFFKTELANCPTPRDGATVVAVDQQLSWLAPTEELYTATGYDVWIGTEPNEASSNYDMTQIVSNGTALTADPGLLENETVYYWHVDAYEPNEVAGGIDVLHTGDNWSFTTEPADVYIEADGDPESLTVDAGEEAVFEVAAVNAESYQWYKDGQAMAGETSATLTISDVQESDEGFYHCVASNDVPSEAISASAQLMTKRLVAHWAFDGDLTETVSGMTVTVIDPNESDGVDAIYDFGAKAEDKNAIVGTGSLYLDNSDENKLEGGWLEVDDSEDLFNFYPQGITISAWVKTPEGQSGEYNNIVSKDDGTESTRIFSRVAGTNGLFRMGSEGVFTDSTISDGQWHLFVSTYDPSTGEGMVYLDGVPGDSESFTPETNTSTLTIGGNGDEGYNVGWIGWIDDLKIYSYPVTTEDVAQAYYEVTNTLACINPSFEGNAYDLDDNCKVDFGDFVLIAESWLNSGLYEPSAD